MTSAARRARRSNTWSHLAATYNGSALTLYLNGVPIGTQAGDRPSRRPRRAPDRRQHDLARVVPGRDRRGTGLQPRPERRRDPGRHERERRQPRHHGADGARHSAPSAGVNCQPHVDGVDGQRRRHALQRPPRHDRRVHAERGQLIAQPTGTELHRRGPRPRHVLLPGHRPGRRRQRAPPSNEAAAIVTGDITAPSAPIIAHRHRSLSSVAPSAGPARPTTWPSRATTCTARRPPASLRAAATGSRSRPARPTTTPGSPPAPTTTGSSPRTQPATSRAFGRGERGRDRRHRGADGARNLTRRVVSQRRAHVERRDRQRRREPLQPPSLNDGRFHAERREPDRAADRRRRFTDPALPPARTTTASPPRTPPATQHAVNEASAVVTGDVTAPTAPGGLTATGGRAASRWPGPRRRTTSASPATTSTARRRPASRRARPTESLSRRVRATPTRPRRGHLLLPGHRRGRSRQHQRPVRPGAGTSRQRRRRPRRRLRDRRGRWHDDRRQGGHEHRDVSGRPGQRASSVGALFDGVNDLVNVPDANSLDLTTAMTLEAWVRPTTLGRTGARFLKESRRTTRTACTPPRTTRPSGNVIAGGVDHDLRGSAALALNTWAHVATTYDGANLSLYVDGASPARRPRPARSRPRPEL